MAEFLNKHRIAPEDWEHELDELLDSLNRCFRPSTTPSPDQETRSIFWESSSTNSVEEQEICALPHCGNTFTAPKFNRSQHGALDSDIIFETRCRKCRGHNPYGTIGDGRPGSSDDSGFSPSHNIATSSSTPPSSTTSLAFDRAWPEMAGLAAGLAGIANSAQTLNRNIAAAAEMCRHETLDTEVGGDVTTTTTGSTTSKSPVSSAEGLSQQPMQGKAKRERGSSNEKKLSPRRKKRQIYFNNYLKYGSGHGSSSKSA